MKTEWKKNDKDKKNIYRRKNHWNIDKKIQKNEKREKKKRKESEENILNVFNCKKK